MGDGNRLTLGDQFLLSVGGKPFRLVHRELIGTGINTL